MGDWDPQNAPKAMQILGTHAPFIFQWLSLLQIQIQIQLQLQIQILAHTATHLGVLCWDYVMDGYMGIYVCLHK